MWFSSPMRSASAASRSALATLARTLGVSLEELLGEESAAAAKKRGPAPKLQRQMERIQHLPAPSSASSCRPSIPCSLSRIAEERS